MVMLIEKDTGLLEIFCKKSLEVKHNLLYNIRSALILKRTNHFILLVRQKKRENVFLNDSILKDCKFLGTASLKSNEKAEINQIYPYFCLAHLSKWESQSNKTSNTNWSADDFIFLPSTEQKKVGNTNGASDNFRKKF